MDVDPDPHKKQKAATLLDHVARLAKAESALFSHSRAIPHGRDFHFYNNFDEFRSPVRRTVGKARPLLSRIGCSSVVSRAECPQELPEDLDDALDWVVNLNDDLLEKFGTVIDEFRRSREDMEAGVGRGMGLEEGFQMVVGKNKKKRDEAGGNGECLRSGEGSSYSGAKIASKDKIHFHNPNIPRPQDEYHILVNNSNAPFDHVWLKKSEDGIRYMHPLEMLSVNDFIDEDIVQGEPEKPLPLSCTPFKLVEGLKDLKELASRLRDVNEFAIDLEHNRYRSFQGMTCLMQISTRTEDFVVDTLKLRVHIGPHLRDIFKDPSKRKVMHGANSDIVWLQRDFGIYVCNLFDTGQASRVLQLERNSLEHLLHHFCGVTANKEYQNAEWRLRPLPDVMLKYAREDTHYLLYIYDVMRQKLLQLPSSSGNGGALMEVYQRSRDICMQLYEKELLTDTSYLHLYGLREADFNSQQLAVAAGLYGWRDTVARAEDESTGYILPNKVLLQIARHMPLTTVQLRRLVRSSHPFVERNLGSVVAVIKNAIQNAPAFEDVCEQLKKDLLDKMNEQSCEANGDDTEPNVGGLTISTIPSTENVEGISTSLDIHSVSASLKTNANCLLPVLHDERLTSISTAELGSSNVLSDATRMAVKKPLNDGNIVSLNTPKTTNIASVPVLKKPSSPFGALLPKKKSNLDVKEKSIEQANAESKLAQIKSSVSLPFHSFSGNGMKPIVVETVKAVSLQHLEPQQCGTDTSGGTTLDDVILLESGACDSPPAVEMSGADGSSKDFMLPENGTSGQSASEVDDKDEPMSLSELYSSFQKLESRNQTKNTTSSLKNRQSEEPNPLFKFQPFDYDAARKQINFGEKEEGEEGGECSDKRKGKGSAKQRRTGVQRLGMAHGQTQSSDFQQPRRRQAFPASGNRSATFS